MLSLSRVCGSLLLWLENNDAVGGGESAWDFLVEKELVARSRSHLFPRFFHVGVSIERLGQREAEGGLAILDTKRRRFSRWKHGTHQSRSYLGSWISESYDTNPLMPRADGDAI